MTATLHHGNSLDILPTLPHASIDAVITDPPYSLGFMNRKWDTFTPAEYQTFTTRWATECLRLLKPGGHLLAFGGTRTSHRLTSGIEDAGFDIRDTITWLYGSGFPKSLDVSKGIDKAAGAERPIIGRSNRHVSGKAEQRTEGLNGSSTFAESVGMGAFVTAPATDDAKTWAGWGTALKPASEPIVVARKPFKGTIASNVLTHGTGALNIDASRVAHANDADRYESEHKNRHADFRSGPRDNRVYGGDTRDRASQGNYNGSQGRWPTNVVLSHTVDCTDECAPGCQVPELDAPSRFFPTFRYQAKAPGRERPKVDGVMHPCVKPLALLRWLINLVVPAGALILDPFAGSGTTLEAAVLEGVHVIGIEADSTYLPLTQQRMTRIGSPLTLLNGVPA